MRSPYKLILSAWHSCDGEEGHEKFHEEEKQKKSYSRIRKTASFDYKVVFGSCKFNLDARQNRGHVDHSPVVYI